MKYAGLGSVIELQLRDVGKFAYGVVVEKDPIDEHMKAEKDGDKLLVFSPILDDRLTDIDTILSQPHRFILRILPQWTRARTGCVLYKVIGIVPREKLPEANLFMRYFTTYKGGSWCIRSPSREHWYEMSLPEEYAFASEDGFNGMKYVEEMLLNDIYPWSASNFKEKTAALKVDFDPVELENRMRRELGLN